MQTLLCSKAAVKTHTVCTAQRALLSILAVQQQPERGIAADRTETFDPETKMSTAARCREELRRKDRGERLSNRLFFVSCIWCELNPRVPDSDHELSAVERSVLQ